MKKKLLFVFNPCSGKAQIKNQLLDIVDTMVKADYEVTIYPTQCAGDAKEKLEAEGHIIIQKGRKSIRYYVKDYEDFLFEMD